MTTIKAIVTKASDYTFFEIMEFNSLEELLDFYDENGDIILGDNFFYNASIERVLEDLLSYHEMTEDRAKEIAPQIPTIKHHIAIYDDYIE